MPTASARPEGNQRCERFESRSNVLAASLTVWGSHLHIEECRNEMYIIWGVKLKIQLEPCA